MKTPVRFVSQPAVTPEYQGLRQWGLFEGIVFGPVLSRRFGRSLGINPLPPGLKICSFDCPYCECGRTTLSMPEQMKLPFPGVEVVLGELESALTQLAADPPDTLTFTGNGEPTMHPQFDSLVDGVLTIRRRLAANGRTACLTNGMFLERASVAAALNRLDAVMVKLDAGTPDVMKAVNLPLATWTPERVVKAVAGLSAPLIQSFFVEGDVSNTSDAEIEAWAALLERIRPRQVFIYTLDRVPPTPGLRRVSDARMEEIRSSVVRNGIPCEFL